MTNEQLINLAKLNPKNAKAIFLMELLKDETKIFSNMQKLENYILDEMLLMNTLLVEMMELVNQFTLDDALKVVEWKFAGMSEAQCLQRWAKGVRNEI